MLLLLVTPWGVQAELFRWVDEHGKVHYSDQKPDQSTSTEVIPVDTAKTLNTTSVDIPQPIIRPQDQASKLLLVLETQYALKSQKTGDPTNKIGAYYAGKGCTSRGAIKLPDVFINHQAFLPDRSELAYRIRKTINSLDYEARKASKYRLIEIMDETDGFSVHSEIVNLQMDSCAPNSFKQERLLPPEKIPLRKYTKHRIKLDVHWIIKANREQDIIYETITPGHFNGWKYNTSSRMAVINALESATRELFAQQELIDKLLQESNQNSTYAKSQSNHETEPGESSGQDADLLSRLYSFATGEPTTGIGKSVRNTMMSKAYAAEVFSDLSQVKVLVSQYFLEQGDWPYSLRDIGLSKRDYENSKVIEALRLHADGSILAELREDRFGDNKYIKITPSTGSSSQFSINRWLCNSNLAASVLPPNCDSP